MIETRANPQHLQTSSLRHQRRRATFAAPNVAKPLARFDSSPISRRDETLHGLRPFYLTWPDLLSPTLGIGANTALFSIVRAVLLEPLPFGEPEHLVQIWESRVDRGWNRTSVSPANCWDFKDRNRTFEDVGAFYPTSVNLTGLGFPERIDAARISAGFFRVLRVSPVLGRTFAPREDQP